MKIKVVLFYSNGKNWTLKDLTGVRDNADCVTFLTKSSDAKRTRISNVVTETVVYQEKETRVQKSDLLGYSIVDGDTVTSVKLSSRFGTFNVVK